ncbi:MAG: hypothetical protein LBV58_04820 [Acholeplasmatales bacterium]|jgi:hypothetical protein|nr:hypothetical protein [Acholeplasmatales bacterium]
MKKLIFFCAFIAFFFLFGILVSFFLDYQFLDNFLVSLSKVKWFFVILSCVFAFICGIFIHESGHLVSFLIDHIKIRCFAVLLFVFFKDNTTKKYKFRINFSLLKILGGFVVPDLPEVNDKNYDDIRRSFSKSLINGPLFSYFSLGIFIFSFIISFIFLGGSFFLGFIFYFDIIYLIFVLLATKSFNLNNGFFFGDRYAYKKILSDEDFFLATLLSYQTFSLNIQEQTNAFLINKVKQILKEKPYSLFSESLIIYYIDSLIFDGLEPDITVNIDSVVRKQDSIQLAYYKVLFNYVFSGDNSFNESYSKFKEYYEFIENSIEDRYLKLLEHNICEFDNSEILLDEDNYWPENGLFSFLIDEFSDFKKYVKRIDKKYKIDEI